MAKILIIIGVLLIMIGVIWLLFPNAFSWIGNMPGDIKHTSGNTRVYFPVVTMIIISIVATVLLNLFNR
ncbi:DUF2905 domain-containing protein [Psychrobacter sp. ANT_WB68]|uniref:DUF2905 domain-containing protein n=1 Tax=Psychrobacter sp. ANT_WB68 TaxID=2597355 RepID=UPI0011F39DD9|nr:DUF2905 domain-containing protein [Psychrobacter sp. ANT_WB68]KAA0915060.1 DUF2905 domain-containing protein [Psychrobacter sp. ANT_WB68]